MILDHDSRTSGLGLVRRARANPHRARMPIILISLEDIEREAMEAGADAFLRKPNNLVELVDTIRRLLASPRDTT
jgi:DNA-binding response OmpR family regulator